MSAPAKSTPAKQARRSPPPPGAGAEDAVDATRKPIHKILFRSSTGKEVCSQCGSKVPKKEPLVEHRDYSDANAELVPWGQYDEDFFRLQCWTTAFKDNPELIAMLRGATDRLPAILREPPSDKLSAAGRDAVKAAVLTLVADQPAPATPAPRQKRPATSSEKSPKMQRISASSKKK
jgi:hypothetical protein